MLDHPFRLNILPFELWICRPPFSRKKDVYICHPCWANLERFARKLVLGINLKEKVTIIIHDGMKWGIPRRSISI